MINVTFLDVDGVSRTVVARGGRTLMEVAVEHEVKGIDAICVGACACATCHVLIEPEWQTRVGPPGDEESELLAGVDKRRANSRLACQIEVREALDGLRVVVPAMS
jgi:2Fe-2S ferredoxin